MTEWKRQLRVFLCHASVDKPIVRDLYRRLVRDGVDVWMDEVRLLPGMDWKLEIPRAVQKADAIIICLSNQSVTKEGYVQKEIRFALDAADEKPDGTIYILPVRLEACEIPSRLARWQWVDLFSSDGYRKLRISLRLRAGAVGAAMPSTGKKFEVENSRVRETPKQAEPLFPEGGKINFGFSGRLVAVLLAVILACAGLLWAGGRFVKWLAPSPLETPLPTSTVTATSTSAPGITLPFSPTPFQPVVFPTATFPPLIPTSTFTFIPPPTQTLVPTLSLTPSSLPFLAPSMVLIPAGAFQMGREGGKDDETPVHTVFLDAFYIDQYEVTNAMYRSCELNGGCKELQVDEDEVPKEYYGNRYLNYPVLYVSWEMAQTYCKWRGGRLPTEAEWEKAARGGLTGMIYPWGNEMPTCVTGSTHGAQFSACQSPKGTLEVRSFAPNGYQIFDMAGNVWEWVADWYDATYYSPTYSSPSNPLGPLSERDKKVLRGGSWSDEGTLIYVANRGSASPDTRDNEIGFRCAKDVSP